MLAGDTCQDAFETVQRGQTPRATAVCGSMEWNACAARTSPPKTSMGAAGGSAGETCDEERRVAIDRGAKALGVVEKKAFSVCPGVVAKTPLLRHIFSQRGTCHPKALESKSNFPPKSMPREA